MNKLLMIGLCVGGIAATAGGALAVREMSPREASVVAVKPITAGMEREYAEVVQVLEVADPSAPRFVAVLSTQPVMERGREEEICEWVTVTHQAPVKDEHQIAGTAAGAVIGGVIGNQIGGGNGKKVATAAGVIVGGVIGKNVQAKHQASQTYETTEQQCRIERGEDRIAGYDVTYQLDGKSSVVFMSHKPGKELPLVGGQVVTDKAEIKRLTQNRAPANYEVFYEYAGRPGSLIMSKAPAVGALLVMEEGRVVTDPQRLAELEAQQHQVVAYQVTYRLGDELRQARTTEKPQVGETVTVKNGRLLLAGDTKATQTL
jgi:uncharacterized protein YcfJ